MIAADTLTNRAFTRKPAKPTTAPSDALGIWLNTQQVSNVLAVSPTKLRLALAQGRIAPGAWDAKGMPMFQAVSLHAMAEELESPKARTPFRFVFQRPGEPVSADIAIEPPPIDPEAATKDEPFA
jgi:hypothetical protein